MILLRLGNAPALGSLARRRLGDHRAAAQDVAVQATLAGRIHDIRPAAQDRERDPIPGERAAMSRGVDPAGHSAHDDQSGRREQPAEVLRDSQPVRARAARSDDGDGLTQLQPADKRPVAAAEEPVRRIGAEVEERGRIAGLASPDGPDRAAPGAQSGPRRRSVSARATWSPETRSHPSRSAIVRESLNTRSCPLPLRRRRAWPSASIAAAWSSISHELRSSARLISALQRPGSKPVLLALTRRDHPAPNARRVGRGRHAHVLRAGALDRDRDVDPVGERPAQLGAVTARRCRLAVALSGLLAAPTRAGVGGRHEHEATRKLDRVTRADDRHPTLLEGLAQRLERLARELPELVQEQHPAVGERHLPGPGRRAAADQARRWRSCGGAP